MSLNTEIVLTVGSEEVRLDPELLTFSEASLNEYLRTCAGWYHYYSAKLAEAQFIEGICTERYEQKYSEIFARTKINDGGSDELVKARSKSDQQVIDASNMRERAKQNSRTLQGYVRALDRAITNALNLGYNLRTDMKHLSSGHSVYESPTEPRKSLVVTEDDLK